MSGQDFEPAARRRRMPLDATLLERLAETGFLATELGLHEQAERIFSCLARIRPGKPSSHIALAMVQARRGLMQAAIASLQEVITRHPESELARAVLGTMLDHIGDPQGRELLQEVIACGVDQHAVDVAAGCIDQARAQTAPRTAVPAATQVAPGAVEFFRHYNFRV